MRSQNDRTPSDSLDHRRVVVDKGDNIRITFLHIVNSVRSGDPDLLPRRSRTYQPARAPARSPTPTWTYQPSARDSTA